MKNQRDQAKRLLRAFGEIDDCYIREALESAPQRSCAGEREGSADKEQEAFRKKGGIRFQRQIQLLAGLAACFLLLVLAGRVLDSGRILPQNEKAFVDSGSGALPDEGLTAPGAESFIAEDLSPKEAPAEPADWEESMDNSLLWDDAEEEKSLMAPDADTEGLMAPFTGGSAPLSTSSGETASSPKSTDGMDIQIEGEEAGNTAMHPPETGTETGAELSLEEAERISGLEMPLPELEGATVGQCSAREGRIELFYFNQEGEEVFRIIKEALDERREELPLESEDGSSAVWTDGRYRWMILSEKEELSPERIREMREKLSSGK